MQNPPSSNKQASIFESPRSCKTIRLGPAIEMASLDLSTLAANCFVKIEQNVSQIMTSLVSPASTSANTNLVAIRSNISPSSSSSTLLDETLSAGQTHSNDNLATLSHLSPKDAIPSMPSQVDTELSEKYHHRKSQKLQD